MSKGQPVLQIVAQESETYFVIQVDTNVNDQSL